MPEIYKDRFDIKYLQEVSRQLELDELKANALVEDKRDGGGRTINCISINYCGIASNTLLGNTTFGVGATDDPDVSYWKTVVSARFKHLLEPSTLNALMRDEFYLKIRFCLAYVYSDFPICLVKAEEIENWQHIRDGTKYDYYCTPPITEQQLKTRSI